MCSGDSCFRTPEAGASWTLKPFQEHEPSFADTPSKHGLHLLSSSQKYGSPGTGIDPCATQKVRQTVFNHVGTPGLEFIFLKVIQ